MGNYTPRNVKSENSLTATVASAHQNAPWIDQQAKAQIGSEKMKKNELSGKWVLAVLAAQNHIAN